MYANARVRGLPATASRPRPSRLIAVPATIHGRRRPQRVLVRSLSQPARIGAISAKRLPAALTWPISRSADPPAIMKAATGTSWKVIGGQCAPWPNHIALTASRRRVPMCPVGGIEATGSETGVAVLTTLKLARTRRARRTRSAPGWRITAPPPHPPGAWRWQTSQPWQVLGLWFAHLSHRRENRSPADRQPPRLRPGGRDAGGNHRARCLRHRLRLRVQAPDGAPADEHDRAVDGAGRLAGACGRPLCGGGLQHPLWPDLGSRSA